MNHRKHAWRTAASILLIALVATPELPAQDQQSATTKSQSTQKIKSKKLTKEELEKQAAALLKEREAQRQAMELVMPRVVVDESNPWTGTDGPILALYRDGRLIYWQPRERGGQYRIVHLSETEAEEFFKRVDTDAIPLIQIPPLNSRITFPQPDPLRSDAPRFSITVRRPERAWRSITLYGSLQGAARKPVRYQPTDLDPIIIFLATYDHPNAIEWIPEQVEVSLWAAVNTEDPPIAWPASLPAPESGNLDKDYGSYSLLLTREQYEQLRSLWEAKPGRNFLSGGRLWRVYVYFPFPHALPFLQQVHSRPQPQPR